MKREHVLSELKAYVASYQLLSTVLESQILRSSPYLAEEEELQNFIESKRKPSLQQVLFSFIDEKGKTDSDIYTHAGIDRKLFSKIRTNPSYHPSKRTILALGFALELKKADLDKLLQAGGYSLSESETSDLVIQYFLEKAIYDIDLVNQGLASMNVKPLTGIL